MPVCLEKRKACETDATPCVCLLCPFKSYITNFFFTENCIYPLGLESGDIPDEALTHSVDTTLTVSDPSGIRLNKNPGGFPNGWQAAMGTLDYIQVEKSWVNLATLFCLWLFQLAYFVKCRPTLQGLSSLERHPSSERERKFRRACLGSPYNVKLGMFTSRSPAVTAKKCTKKVCCTCKFVVLFLLLFWRYCCRRHRSHFKVPSTA